jgi:hypothetical protein
MGLREGERPRGGVWVLLKEKIREGLIKPYERNTRQK